MVAFERMLGKLHVEVPAGKLDRVALERTLHDGFEIFRWEQLFPRADAKRMDQKILHWAFKTILLDLSHTSSDISKHMVIFARHPFPVPANAQEVISRAYLVSRHASI